LERGADPFYTVESGERAEGSIRGAIINDAPGKRRTYSRERLDRRGRCNVNIDEEPLRGAIGDSAPIRFAFGTCTHRSGLDAKRRRFLGSWQREPTG
jgi:hypothetical protein